MGCDLAAAVTNRSLASFLAARERRGRSAVVRSGRRRMVAVVVEDGQRGEALGLGFGCEVSSDASSQLFFRVMPVELELMGIHTNLIETLMGRLMHFSRNLLKDCWKMIIVNSYSESNRPRTSYLMKHTVLIDANAASTPFS